MVLQYDLAEMCKLSDNDEKAFQQMADSCTDGHWIWTSAKSGFNVEKAVHMIVQLVWFL